MVFENYPTFQRPLKNVGHVRKLYFRTPEMSYIKRRFDTLSFELYSFFDDIILICRLPLGGIFLAPCIPKKMLDKMQFRDQVKVSKTNSDSFIKGTAQRYLKLVKRSTYG